ncbi:MAG TPA: DUF222 domain-containing protein, partial [Streptosporangiaceae bacterium]|nr:DUF222 domain-containing protein [Streptosporangiaceae bacterium]
RALGRAESKHTAARSRVLAAFAAQDGHDDDGHGSARAWVRWQTRVTRAAAAGAVGWMRRLAAHPVIGEALAAGNLSPSWARAVCDWSDLLPENRRGDADAILVAAADGGADLAALAGLAREMYERSQPADGGGDDGFDDRYLRLGITFRGAGRADGDLTPGCAAALSAVLDALGKKTGPEDTRTAGQRRHDALYEACRRLIAAGMIPGRAGQHRQLMVHISLAELRGMPGSSGAEAAWVAAARQHGWLTGPDAQAAACDATIIPIVTGHLDPAALDHLVDVFLAAHGLTSSQGASGPGASGADGCGCTCGGCTCPARTPLSPHTRQRLRNALLALATDALSGPGGLAAHLRARLASHPGLPSQPLAAISLPLDTGAATETIPAHLRRAVTARHPHCAFPGCTQPASACEAHHLIPRSQGGPTVLHNLVNLCTFHHQTVIHRWGWHLRLHADGTTTATSPNGRTLHSHSPPHNPPASDHDPPSQAA